MHHARFHKSKRLQRVYRFLRDGEEHSTRDIVYSADVCAASTIVQELRENGCNISCQQRNTQSGMIWVYQLHNANSNFDRVVGL